MFKTFAFVVIMGVAVALPADNVLDKATANDVYANSVHPDEFSKVEKEEKRETQTVVTEFKPESATKNPHPATTFGRLIDDIFNIPITVLQSVAKLLQNPFKSAAKTPEESTKY